MPLSPDDRELFVEIGYHIARVMWRNLGDADPAFRAGMSDGAVSVYGHGCGVLRELGVFRLGEDGRNLFDMPLEAVRDHLRQVPPDLPGDFDEMIGTFLWAAGPYQGDISDEKAPFEVPGHMQQAMWAFVARGYATRRPGGFQWTGKIAPIMVGRYLWSREGESFTTLDKAETEDLADRIWSAIPVWRRHLLARRFGGGDISDLTDYLSRRWDGERLRLFEGWRRKGAWRFTSWNLVKAVSDVAERLKAMRRGQPF